MISAIRSIQDVEHVLDRIGKHMPAVDKSHKTCDSGMRGIIEMESQHWFAVYSK